MADLALALLVLVQAAVGPGPGDILVTNFGGASVSWYDGESGRFGGHFVPPGRGGLDRPVGIAFGPDGDLYVSSAGTDQVLRYDGDTGAFEGVFAADPVLRIPSLLRFGPDDDLYVGTFAGGRVLRFDGETGELVATVASGLTSPIGLAFGPDGTLVVASAGQDRIARFDPDTGEHLHDVVAGQGLAFPTGVAFVYEGAGSGDGPPGVLLVSSLQSGEVLAFHGESGSPRGPAFDLPEGAGPTEIAFDARGRVLVADLNLDRLYRVDGSGGAVEVFADEGLDGPEGIAIKPAAAGGR